MKLNTNIKRLESAKGILFDLDNTLYPRERGVFKHINRRINEYVRHVTGSDGIEVDRLRKEYVDLYGTTLGGLMQNHRVNAEDYLDFVHDVPVEELLQPDASLISFLRSIELPTVIFTNGTRNHAERVLRALGIEIFFDGICDLAATGYLGKPHRKAFDRAAEYLDCTLDKTIFIDDLGVNVKAGADAGAFTILVDGKGEQVGDMRVVNVKELKPVFSPMPWYHRSPHS